jgi:YD repeat-containing protein
LLCSGYLSSVCRQTDARSITTIYAYDALNRLTSKTYSDSTSAVALTYDVTTLDGLTFQNQNTVSLFVEVCGRRVVNRNSHRNSYQDSLRPSAIQDEPMPFAQWSKPFFEDLVLLLGDLSKCQAHAFSRRKHNSGRGNETIAAFGYLYSYGCSQGK